MLVLAVVVIVMGISIAVLLREARLLRSALCETVLQPTSREVFEAAKAQRDRASGKGRALREALATRRSGGKSRLGGDLAGSARPLTASADDADADAGEEEVSVGFGLTPHRA